MTHHTQTSVSCESISIPLMLLFLRGLSKGVIAEENFPDDGVDGLANTRGSSCSSKYGCLNIDLRFLPTCIAVATSIYRKVTLNSGLDFKSGIKTSRNKQNLLTLGRLDLFPLMKQFHFEVDQVLL